MPENLQTAERWVVQSVREHFVGSLVRAGTYLAFAAVGGVLWFGLTFGLMFMFSIVLSAAGVGLDAYKYIVIGVYAAQIGVYLFVRNKGTGRWEVSTDVDGNVLVAAPEYGSGGNAFAERGIVLSLFFCVPIALEEAWRDIMLARRIRGIDTAPVARLANLLFNTQRKVNFDELTQHMSNQTLQAAITDAALLPSFQLFVNEPQGVALTSTALEEMAVA